MDYSYGNRHYLLPKGCKNLIDAIHIPRQIGTEVVKREDGIIYKFKVADLREANADIVFEGRLLRIVEKSRDRPDRRKLPYPALGYNFKGKDTRMAVTHRILAVPIGHDLAKALTTYTEDEVRIFVPKC